MEQLKHIMTIFDEAHEQQTALLRGIELSRRCGANLHIVSVLYSTLNFIHGDILVETEEVLRQRLIERRNVEIDTILTTVNTDDINITRDILWTPVAHEEVAQLCREYKVDLVIKTASKHSRLEGFIHTPQDWLLLRECPCSVLIVTTETWPQGSKVLAAVDTTSADAEHRVLNKRILEQAAMMGEILQDPVHVATACAPLPVLIDMDYTVIDPNVYVDNVRANAEKHGQAIVADSAVANDNFHVVIGQPEFAINELAEKLDSRMIVLGTVSRSGLNGYLIGNTAEQMLYNMTCDILAVKPQPSN